VALETLVALDKVLDFFRDEGNVGTEGFLGETELDKLQPELAGDNAREEGTCLLLLHQLRVGAVVDDILAKDRCRELAVDLLGVDILDLAIEDEVVAGCVKAHGHFLTKEDKGEDIAVLHASQRVLPLATVKATHLLLAGKEELVGVDAVGDGAADDGDPVEDERRLIGVLEQQLVEDVEDDGEQEEGAKAGRNEDGEGRVGGEVAHRAGDISENTHNCAEVEGGAVRA
jgi:hypothetical protein